MAGCHLPIAQTPQENYMASAKVIPSSLSRRSLVKQLGLAPLLLRPSALSMLVGTQAFGQPASPMPEPSLELRYKPLYPAPSPLEDVLRLVQPGLDEFTTEVYAAQLETILETWAQSFEQGRLNGLWPALANPLEASPMVPGTGETLRDRNGISTYHHTYPAPQPGSPDAFIGSLERWIGAAAHVSSCEFQITAIDERAGTLDTSIRYSLTTEEQDGSRHQRVGLWQVRWISSHPQTPALTWQVARFEALSESRTVSRSGGFRDVTEAALGSNPSYAKQLCKGVDYWRTVLDGACGIDLYGNNGIAAGDYNNDGFDDLYVSQPAGLPNRLYRNRGDGTLEDVTEHAGVGVLDNTACALFADFRNSGLQDLLVVCGSGPLLFLNQGDGTFRRKSDAFRFIHPPQGTFTHAAVADYDRDGRLDIYFCLYSYYLGLDQYHYPAPYFDARNGPPNFLMHNEGEGTFTDRTEQAGMNTENNRYSFACSWCENEGEAPDLYVVNDFGRNNLYRNQGSGKFASISEQAHVQDVGAGMSAAWADYANTGRPGIYVANMWSAAGQRISHAAAFQPKASPAVRALYQHHALGNALYRNDGAGFTNVGEQANAEMGRWAWGSDFFDFDHDGYQDLYITNGYITAPRPAKAPAIDLGSFFWRQVVGRSPDDATPSLRYEHGWNALNELIRTDSSWSGHERNVLLANNGDGSFAELSGPLGLDFLEDGRSFALADLDGDGRLEIILKNRNGPQLRILHNDLSELGDVICFRLRGTVSNRDAIGTRITLHCGALTQTRSLQAGSGFLAQHTKELFFGLGKGNEAVHAEVRWPNGKVQQLHNLPRNNRVLLTEGEASPTMSPFTATSSAYTKPAPAVAQEDVIPTTLQTWLLAPLQAPDFTLPTAQGGTVSLSAQRGHPVLLHLWSSAAPGFTQQLRALDALSPVTLPVLGLNLDDPQVQVSMRLPAVGFPHLLATPEIAGIYNLIFRYLFDRRANLPLPSSFLIDAESNIVRVYQGPVRSADLLADLRELPAHSADRTKLALPFAGHLYQGSFQRNDFTYGVAMFQHGYLDQAAISFEQVIAARPTDAEAHYNLGTLNLRRNRLPAAREQLQQTLKLKPDYPEAWNNLGMMAAQQGQTEEAIANFKQCLALRPDYPTALLNLGNLYRHARSFADAATYLKRALTLQPDDPEAVYSLGMLFAQQAEFSNATEYLQKALVLRPDYPEASNNLGVLYVREGDNVRAEQQFLTARRLSPAYQTTYLNLARLYMTMGDRAKARQAITDLLQQDPASAAGKQALQALDGAAAGSHAP